MVYKILLLVATLLLGYFVGAIPNGVIVSKIFFHYDIREYGSHNSGGTNAGRVMGKKFGALVIILDIMKVIIPFAISVLLFNYTALNNYCLFNMPQIYYYGICLAGTIGHCWPIYIGFKGGKAVSCTAGSIICTSYISLIISFISFIVTLKKSKHVSSSSIAGSLTSAILSFCVFIPGFNRYFLYPGLAFDYTYIILMCSLFIILLIRHKQNIKRLINKEESTISWMK